MNLPNIVKKLMSFPVFFLFLSILLMLSSFLFTLSCESSSAQIAKQDLITLAKEKTTDVFIQGEIHSEDYFNFFHGFEKTDEYSLTSQQKDVLRNYLGGSDLTPVYFPGSDLGLSLTKPLFDDDFLTHYQIDVNSASVQDQLSLRNFDVLIEADTLLPIQPDSRFLNPSLCRLPVNKDEISLTDFKASFFIRYGFPEEDQQYSSVKTPDDLMGKKISGKTIVGVYATSETEDKINEQAKNSKIFLEGKHLANALFVAPGYFQSSQISENSQGVFLTLKEDQLVNQKLIENLTYQARGNQITGNISHLNYHYSVRIFSSYSGYASQAYQMQFNQRGLFRVLRSIGILCWLFSIVLCLVRLHQLKKKGMELKERITLSLISGIVGLLLSLIITAFIPLILNSIVGYEVYGYTWIIPVLSLLVSLSYLLLSILPIVIGSKQKKS